MSGREPRRPSSILDVLSAVTDEMRECEADCGGETRVAIGGGLVTEDPMPHVPSIAFALQLLLIFARVAAVSESLSFSA